jgi:hypothetical protein
MDADKTNPMSCFLFSIFIGVNQHLSAANVFYFVAAWSQKSLKSNEPPMNADDN